MNSLYITLASTAAGAIALTIDWLQTRTIAKNPDKWKETNPYLGEHPELIEVNHWFATWMVLLLLATAFAYHWVEWFGPVPGIIAFCIEIWYVVGNYKLGIKP